ncbi:Na(+)-translocating NADH-quinone reductase subunit C [Candidatus Laterigemmans baculatus]|uniref:Na(+)-translocating NADH-quinone reductase subunit C n=1 Tax=Candidatus Laterigemmans baculatus TaxID=2770505 RepID=UPI0013DADE47|nr:Na(+)-translocating NADH-quinone reductase subunit C [Candidatus Laterigemmans baculatus]
MSQRESLGNTFLVALVLCVVCSLGVSTAAVALRDRQETNRALDRKKNILDATGIAYDETGAPASELSIDQVNELYKRIDETLVDLETGEYVTDIDVETYDERQAAKEDPKKEDSLAVAIEDPAYDIGFRQRERIARVYFVRDEAGEIEQVVLPVYGKGLWSTLYGYLAVRDDLQTVQGLTFYEHAETPGLGGEVENPMWKAQWTGLYLYGEEGNPAIEVAKGVAPEGNQYMVDGLSGATITARGVSNLVRYWISDDGFGPFLRNLADEMGLPARPGLEEENEATSEQAEPAATEEPNDAEN